MFLLYPLKMLDMESVRLTFGTFDALLVKHVRLMLCMGDELFGLLGGILMYRLLDVALHDLDLLGSSG